MCGRRRHCPKDHRSALQPAAALDQPLKAKHPVSKGMYPWSTVWGLLVPLIWAGILHPRLLFNTQPDMIVVIFSWDLLDDPPKRDNAVLYRCLDPDSSCCGRAGADCMKPATVRILSAGKGMTWSD